MNIKRWVWLEIPVLPANVSHYGEKQPTTVKHMYYVPKEILDHIPVYKAQSRGYFAKTDGDVVARDGTARDQQAVTRAIRFLTSGDLPVTLDNSCPDYEKALHDLVQLYNFSIALQIGKLENAVLGRIDNLNFEALTLNIFLGFARSYYNGDGADTQNSSLGRLIKKKLSLSLPRLQKTMTAEKISSEGGVLGKQLIAVLFEDRAQSQVALGSVKRER
jgi:hypothetical protein